jgi:hypothetical protein
MGKGIQTGQEAAQGHQLSVHAHHQGPRAAQARRRARKRKRVEPLPALGEELGKSVYHFFPQFRRWLTALPDVRQQGKVVYDKSFCIWSALSIFMQALGSRRQFDREALVDAARPAHCLLENLNRLAGTEETDILHGDTLNDYLCLLPPRHLAQIPHKMAGRLIRMRALDYARLFGMYLIVIDATGIRYSAKRHCEYCLTQKHSGKTVYYHLVLEAKLITPEGMVFSVGSEFIENTDPKATKQDCELAGFPRLAAKIKERFPRLPICVLLDGLYANQHVFSLCRQYHWHWIISFQQGSLPTAFREFHTLKALCPNNTLETRVKDRYQRLTWVSDLEHEAQRFSAFDCLTYNDDLEPIYFAWITDLPVSTRRVVRLANHGGRKRWTIENQGFNNQKNQGYGLEHAYSDNNDAIKNYYFILQIAHTIVQLLIHGPVAAVFKSLIGTMKNFFRRLADDLRHLPIPAAAVSPEDLGRIQIRLAPT